MITRRTNEVVVTIGCGSAATAAALLGGLFTIQPALGQDSGTVTVDVERCFELESVAARRACFGAQVDETSNERELLVQAATETRAVDQSRGLETDEGEYFGTIVAMRERLPSSYVIRLDNGQMWEQTEPKKYPLRPGLQVRIYPTRWGTRYRLSGVGSGGHIQVRRVNERGMLIHRES